MYSNNERSVFSIQIKVLKLVNECYNIPNQSPFLNNTDKFGVRSARLPHKYHSDQYDIRLYREDNKLRLHIQHIINLRKHEILC